MFHYYYCSTDERARMGTEFLRARNRSVIMVGAGIHTSEQFTLDDGSGIPVAVITTGGIRRYAIHKRADEAAPYLIPAWARTARWFIFLGATPIKRNWKGGTPYKRRLENGIVNAAIHIHKAHTQY